MTKKDDLFNEKNIPESNWFKFETVGDRVSGEVVEIFEKPEVGEFAAQRCFSLKQDDESIIHVGIKKTNQYLMGRTNNVVLGDRLGIEFKAEIPPKVKGFHPAKSMEVYIMKGEAKSGFGDFDPK